MAEAIGERMEATKFYAVFDATTVGSDDDIAAETLARTRAARFNPGDEISVHEWSNSGGRFVVATVEGSKQ